MGSETIKGAGDKKHPELTSRDTYPSCVPLRTRCMELALGAANYVDVGNGAGLIKLAQGIEAYIKGEA